MSMAQQKPEINELLKGYAGTTIPGAALMLIKNGKPVYVKNFGMANLEAQETVGPLTSFRLASVTKQFTAASILMLVNEQKLTLDTRLTEALPSFPLYGSMITIRNLLNHTSGLPNYEKFVADTAFNPQILDKGVLDILIKLPSDTKLLFEPGSKFQYSNTGYALLSLIIEKYSGKPFNTFLKERIFKPLKMHFSVAYQQGMPNMLFRACGYTLVQGIYLQKDQSSTSAVLGDGGIYSTTQDLYKWDQSLYTEKLLPKALWEQAFSPTKLNNGELINYGFGWHLKTYENQKVVYHTGSTTSFRNIIYRIPSKKITLILLTNRNKPAEENMVELADKHKQIYNGRILSKNTFRYCREMAGRSR
ncbi:MAG: class A beta-lactamase-related serine hydrolase [Chitinophagaceae bacterium]|nr:MAG: class A beta-lactamase-related serine hydrolase [Chitinophagaceae bacterium]